MKVLLHIIYTLNIAYFVLRICLPPAVLVPLFPGEAAAGEVVEERGKGDVGANDIIAAFGGMEGAQAPGAPIDFRFKWIGGDKNISELFVYMADADTPVRLRFFYDGLHLKSVCVDDDCLELWSTHSVLRSVTLTPDSVPAVQVFAVPGVGRVIGVALRAEISPAVVPKCMFSVPAPQAAGSAGKVFLYWRPNGRLLAVRVRGASLVEKSKTGGQRYCITGKDYYLWFDITPD